MTTIPFDTFVEKYKPITNPFNPDAPENGLVFETHGAELDFVRAQQTTHILTLLDDGTTIIFGYHLVNRLGYIITGVPFRQLDFKNEFTLD